MSKKSLVGFNVYLAPEGCDESFFGFVEELDQAHELVEGGAQSLPRSLYETARVAGHCYGICAPDKTGEAEEPAEWFGPEGECCAVPVYRAVPREQIRHGSFGPIVWAADGSTRAATQADMDDLPVGPDLTDEEEASIEE